MEHRGKADDRCGFFDQLPHGALAAVGVADDLGQRAVVADGAGQDERHVVLYDAVDDAVVDVIVLDELRDRAAAAHLVDDVQMVIVAVGLGLLRIDILTERGVQQRAFQIVRGKGIAGHEAVCVAVFDQRLHGSSGVLVKGKRGAHDPEDIAVLLLIAQKLDQPVIVLGIGGLAAASLTEHKLILQRLAQLLEAVAVHVNAVLAVFRPP